MSVKKTSRTLMAVGLSAVMSAALAKTQVLDDSDPKVWDGADTITGEVTKPNVLVVGDETAAPNGLTIIVTNNVENALNIKTDGSASKAVLMGGPLAVQTHGGCDTRHLLLGNGGENDAAEPFDVNLDWGNKAIDIRFLSNSVMGLANIVGQGLHLQGNGGTSTSQRSIAKLAGGIDVKGGDVLIDGAVIEFGDEFKGAKAAFAGGRGLNNATGDVTFRNRGGMMFGYQPLPKDWTVHLEHGGIFGFKEGNWSEQEDKGATTYLDVVGSGYFFCHFDDLPRNVKFGGLKLAQGSVLYLPCKRGENRGFVAPSEGVTIVGGDGSTASRQPLVPGLVRTVRTDVATEFGIRMNHITGAYTYDSATGAFMPYPEDAWSSDWENASAVDNMKVAASVTLSRDTSANAVLFAANEGLVDCGGNALEVESGFFLGTWNNPIRIKNGTLNVGKNPICMVANESVTVEANLVTINEDPEKPVFFWHGGGYDYRKARLKLSGDNSQAVGRFYFGRQFAATMRATFAGVNATSRGMVLDSGAGTEFDLTSTWDKPKQIAHLKGLGGCGKLTSCSTSDLNDGEAFFWVPSVVVGDDSASPLVNPSGNARKVYVCNGGFIEPGELTTKGSRVGTFTIEADKYRHLREVEFAEGGELRIRVGKNGECTRLAVVDLTEGVKLGGTLSISEAAGVKGGVPYTILTSIGPISGAFASVTTGWKTAIVENEDGTYALTATKSANGFSIIIR